ncbi:hypothetical protein GCM10009745_69550 [Kribbella yunnanensis]|uniref:Type VII secretion system protein EssD-like domain-containing protein n=2 Tax=Kribbella yunnanensis TaxID=190194 RepID=A0ABN2ITP6_9ACTN
MSSNPAGRMAAVQLDEAARRCDEAAHYASIAPQRAREWAVQMVTGVRTVDRGAGARDAPAGESGDARKADEPEGGDRGRTRVQLDLRGGDGPHPPADEPQDDVRPIKLSTSNPDDLPQLNTPPANAKLRVDDKFNYETDNAGRVIRANAVLDLIDLNHPRDGAAQRRLAGKLPGDHAGHIFARIFRGPIGRLNLLPMQGTKVNLSQYKTLENHWRRLIGQGERVEVSVSFKFSNDSQRPDTIRVRYKHAGGVVRVSIDNNPKQRGSTHDR